MMNIKQVLQQPCNSQAQSPWGFWPKSGQWTNLGFPIAPQMDRKPSW
jgi:hypothetical protein